MIDSVKYKCNRRVVKNSLGYILKFLKVIIFYSSFVITSYLVPM